MERRFCSLVVLRYCLLVVSLTVLGMPSFGCSRNGTVAPSYGDGTAGTEGLLKQAREYSQRGESHRAEQYFLAALESGASPDDVYPELIDACIRGGRLGSASVHVDKRLRERPRDLNLLRLSISLEEGLGHERKATLRALELSSKEELSPEQALFLSGYFERLGQVRRALELLGNYLARADESERPLWVYEARRRLETALLESSQPMAALHSNSSDVAREVVGHE